MARFSTPRAAVRAAVRDVVYPITGVSGIDSDAAAYIAAIEGDGVTVSGAQQAALDAFFRAGKTDGWYSNLQRFYLPIWGAAAPNARCLVSGTSGTFVGGVTHAAGYAQGNGSTGYFDCGVSLATLGCSDSDTLVGRLKKADTTSPSVRRDWGVFDSAIKCCRHATSTTDIIVDHCSTSIGNVVYSAARSPGIESFLRTSGRHYYTRRDGSSHSILGSDVIADNGTIPNEELFFMALNFQGTAASNTDAEFGAFYVGSGFSATDEVDFTSALKTLWETCTGLTLP